MDYKSIIESRYNRQNWQSLLHDIFGSKIKFWNTPSVVPTNSPFVKQALWLGTITLSDEQTISVYEVELADSVDIERNRRGIRDMLLTAWRNNGNAGAFMFCYRRQESVLRFSYVSESWTFADDGTYQKESTDTKRFTYLLGEGHRSRTAIQQFEKLRDSAQSLIDLTKAFSVEAVSDMFFKGYKQQYEDIIFYVTGKRMVKVANKWEEQQEGQPNAFIMQQFAHFQNPEKAIRDYVKKLMGRLVFLQFLQKKGWLGVPVGEAWGNGDPEFLQNLFAAYADKDHFIDNVLEPLFNDLNTEREGNLTTPSLGGGRGRFLIPYLNGGLFEREATDETEFPLPARYMQLLLDFFSSYNFTIDENDPDDAEVGVDPEMLGRIFENLLEDNKDKGAFYTPKEIVTYMCRESLISYLQTDIADEPTKEAIRQFVTTHQVLPNLPEDIDQKLKDVKICDPAIGSGAFPMGLLKELFLCRTALEGISQHQAAEIKKHIIQQNIYGVDIERGAVDIARLRFWLSLVVDEDTPKALPNLDYKIVEGNSLITTFDGQYIDLSTKSGTNRTRFSLVNINRELNALQAVKLRYFGLSGEEKYRAEIEIKRHILNCIWYQLDFERESDEKAAYGEYNLLGGVTKSRRKNKAKVTEFTEERQHVFNKCEELLAMLDDNTKTLRERANTPLPFFDWKIYFSEIFVDGGGFDIVIGNPPYGVSIKGDYRNSVVSSLGQVPDYEIYYYFFEIAKVLIKEDGLLSYIVPNTWLFNTFAKKYRKSVLCSWTIEELLDCSKFKIFESATVLNTINLFRKTDGECQYCKYRTTTRAMNFNDLISEKRDVISGKDLSDMNQNWALAFRLSSDVIIITSKISNFEHPISEYFETSQGLIAYDKYQGQSPEIIKNRVYHFSTYHKGLKKCLWGEDVRRYNVKWNEKEWIDYCEGIANPRRPEFFIGKRLLIREITNPSIYATITSDELYNDPSIIIVKDSPLYNLDVVLGILNSKLATFYHFNHSPKATKGAFPKILVQDIKDFPLPNIIDSTSQAMSRLVNSILGLKKENYDKDTSKPEQEIDHLVYHLYGLTYDEVLIVDPETPITREEYERNAKS